MPTSLAQQYQMASAFARSLRDFCAVRSVDLAGNARAHAIDMECFQDTTRFISLVAFVSLMEDLAATSGDDCFGLHFGEFFKLGDSGPFGFGLMNAPSCRQAFVFYKDFIPLTADYAHFSAVARPDSVIIQWRYSPLVGNCSQYADLMALLTIRQFRLHAGAAGFPAAVKLMRARPDQISEHHRLMCANLTFGAQVNEISFPTERLQHCNPASDVRLFEIMSKQCREALARRQAQLPLELRVRHEIHLRLASGEVSLSAISSHLGMSERSLQRQMQDLGTGFERLLDETRQELCVQLFADQGMKLEAIANALGFASQASFTRAAKRWFGIPPGQARSRSRGDTLA